MSVSTKHIINYLEGGLSLDERQSFEKRLDESVEFRREVEEIALVWKTSNELKIHQSIDVDRNWQELTSRIKRGELKLRIFKYTRSAAAILLLPVLLYAGMLFSEVKYLSNQTIAQLEVTSAQGTISRAVLPDGTEVWLNSGATLSYPERFNGGHRMVNLTGEAYFKVKSDKSNRFEVMTPNNLMVSAYGTEFNVNAYENQETIDVTLVNGNVEVVDVDSKKNCNMIAGQYLVYGKSDKKMSVSYPYLPVKTDWKDGKMVFRRASMTEVTKRLSRHFNVDINLEGRELYDYEYSATFTTESLAEILHLLKKTAPIQYKIAEPKQSTDYSFSKKTVTISIK